MQPQNPDFLAAVEAAFSRQPFMHFIGARLGAVEPGGVEIRLPYHEGVGQNHGYFQGEVIGAVADSAGGLAGFSLLPPGSSVLAVEYKISFLSPGNGDKLVARGEVLRVGRTLVTTEIKAHVLRDGEEHLCAVVLQTLRALSGGGEIRF